MGGEFKIQIHFYFFLGAKRLETGSEHVELACATECFT